MTTPNVAIRFTAEDDGVAAAVRELSSQLRGLTTQAARTDDAVRQSAKGFNAMARSLADVATAIGVVRLAGFVRETVTAADEIGKLAQKTGASAETLSALAVAGQTADVSLDQLTTSFRFLNKNVSDLRGGSAEAVKAFRAIGLSIEDIKGLSVDQIIRKVFDAIAKLPDGSAKAAAALKLFGRSGTELIPLLNDLSERGIGGAIDKARSLGLLLDTQTTKAAEAFNDSLTEMKQAATGLAGELARGVVPTITALATSTAHAIASLPPGLKALIGNLAAVEGGILGVAAALRVLKLVGLGALLSNPFGLAAVAIGALAAVLLTLSGSADRAKRAYGEFLDTLNTPESIDAERARLEAAIAAKNADIEASRSTFARLGLLKQRKTLEEQLQQLEERAARTPATPDAGGDGVADDALLKARLEARRSGITSELNLEEARNRSLQQMNQEQFDTGLQSLALYFQRRLGLTRESVAAEIKALSAQRALLVAQPAATPADAVRRQSDIANLDRQIEQKRTEGEQKERELLAQRAQLEATYTQQRLAAEAKVQEARGETLAVALAAIDREAAAFRQTLAAQGVSGSAQDAAVKSFTTALQAQAEFNDLSRRVQAVFDQLEQERTRITQAVQVGTLTELQGQQQIAQAEASRLPTLRTLADAMGLFAGTLQNPEMLAQVEALNTQITGLAASSNLAAQEAARFKANLQSAVESDIATFLGDTIDQVDSLREAFLSLALSVVQSIQRIVAELIAARLARGLSSLLGLAGSAGAGGFDPGPQEVVPTTLAFATGGVVPGAGTGDTVPAMLTPGEGVLSRGDMAALGGASGFMELRRQLGGTDWHLPTIRHGVQHLNAGGLVVDNPVAAPSGGSMEATLGLEEGLVVKHLKSSRGNVALREWVRDNRSYIKAAIG